MNAPKGSEITIGEWLTQVGCTDVEYVGDGVGPPDFTAKYADDRIAVEATRLVDHPG